MNDVALAVAGSELWTVITTSNTTL